MKVSITENSKKTLAIADVPAAKATIKHLKDDNTPLSEYANLAFRAAFKEGYPRECYTAEAEVTINHRVWQMYGDDSGCIDVWIDSVIRTTSGICLLGFYLSDILNLSDDTRDYVKHHMSIRKFKEVYD